jgi:RNA recognition motif-containing protein
MVGTPGEDCLRSTQRSRWADGHMQNRLYVGNLGGEVAASTLQELFEPHGFVMDVRLVAGDKSGPARGSAFVTMATDESAWAAMSALNGVSLRGIEMRVEMADLEGAGGVTGAGGAT